MVDPLSDSSPLIGAASAGKLRLVRLLVEGGSRVNGCNPRGETALLAACKALRGEPAGPETLRLLTYLLRNKADPNAQDQAGRTALMYACMERAGAQVASALLSAGADPSMEDHSGASALVYAINAQHQPTLKVLMDACRARGRDIIIIATEMGANGDPVTRRYLNVPPSPDTSPVSCMSPSDILLKTGPPDSPEGENIFNFRATNKPGSGGRDPSREPSPPSRCGAPPARQRISSEPWLAIHDPACLNRAYDEGTREGGGERPHSPDVRRRGWVQRRDNGCGGENYSSCAEAFSLRVSHSLTEISSSHAKPSGAPPKRCPTPGGPDAKPHSQLRRNTLPSVTVVPPQLHLPPLADRPSSFLRVPAKVPPSRCRSMVFLPHPPDSPPLASTCKASVRPGLLPQLPLASSITSLVAPPASSYRERSTRSLRRHSVQME